MNIAFFFFFFFVVLLPGIAWRRSLYAGRFSKQYVTGNLFSMISVTLVPALIAHTVGLFVIELIGNPLRYDILGKLMTGAELSDCDWRQISFDRAWIVTYFVVVIITCLGFGYATRRYIRWRQWDLREKLLRYKNYWHYYFSGEFVDFTNNGIESNLAYRELNPITEEEDKVDMRYVYALVNDSGVHKLYRGLLLEYELNSSTGELETLFLGDVSKRELEPKDEEREFNPISGGFLAIKYEDILNMSIQFYSVYETDDGFYVYESIRSEYFNNGDDQAETEQGFDVVPN